MHLHTLDQWRHSHEFHTDSARGERRTRYVVLLTACMMVIEIAAGYHYGSMALLADGWHMGTHVAALGISLFAYSYARRHATNPYFSFGTGKVASLGGFASAVALAVVALLMGMESIERLLSPQAIRFNEAILVAVVGLAVNLLSAWLLRGDHEHHHHHDHAHQHDHADHHHHDHNLRAAYMHVLADALTSVLAILALLCGRAFGWIWMDALMGVVGAVVISRWSLGLIRESSGVLLDSSADDHLAAQVRSAIENEADNRIADLHLWRVGPNRFAAIISLVTHDPREPVHYKQLLADFGRLVHVTIEVNGCPGDACH
ncbi:MAG: CDF family Co(II)/Ni(II) efflux transporter DmeF [Gammaproteobacteria bacterium]|nr:CDF family Co(II)/Ni(II) efflux transporter DmeF [Gammaproteobacteria bacterium]